MVSGSDFVNSAIQNFLNLPYTWGNNDCSGIIQKTAGRLGLSLPRVSSQQWQATVPVPMNSIQPGDLVFYNPGTAGAPPGLPGHVAIYVGGNQTFQALNPSHPIGFGTLNDPNLHLMGVRRIPGINGAGAGVNATPIAAGPGGAAPAPAASPPSDDTCVLSLPLAGCIFNKSQARALIGGITMAGGVVLLITGTVAVFQGLGLGQATANMPMGKMATSMLSKVPL